jgi:uncharacterized iron-regulated protein
VTSILPAGRPAIAATLALAGAAHAEPAALADVVAVAKVADVVVLGEVHDNPGHHMNQAAIVGAVQPPALVFEMIPQAMEDAVNALRAEGAARDEIAVALDWETSGWPDFAHYAAILEAAPGARIFGGGQAEADLRLAAEEGAAIAFGVDAPTYRLDVALPPAEQAAREAEMLASHCDALPEAALPGMVEVQRFRDAALADAALWARTLSGAQGPVVVIAGSGHADRRRGVPAMIAAADPGLDVLALGQVEAEAPEVEAMFDAYLVAPPPERDDPCEGFEMPDR